LGDCGEGPAGDPTARESDDAGADAGAAKQAEHDGEGAKAPTAGTKGADEASGDGSPPIGDEHVSVHLYGFPFRS
jgi:hypothetical protein